MIKIICLFPLNLFCSSRSILFHQPFSDTRDCHIDFILHCYLKQRVKYYTPKANYYLSAEMCQSISHVRGPGQENNSCSFGIFSHSFLPAWKMKDLLQYGGNLMV